MRVRSGPPPDFEGNLGASEPASREKWPAGALPLL